MSKRFTKIICTAIAAISITGLAFAPACSVKWSVPEADSATKAVEGTNGGLLTETEKYVYFINGKATNTDTNKFGSVVKGSVQRIAKSDLDAGNYANTDTVVPSVIYSGNYNAGLYIYGGYVYYTTPSTEKNTDGEVLNTKLDFKRTKLDGKDTTKGYIWQSSDNAVDYRYVEVDGTVYILYAISENLYGTTATNIHAVNCTTKENVILAYNVASYAFDTINAENPYVYYTMAVPQFIDGSGTAYSYNQLYRVKANVTESPREYDFSDVEDYDAKKDPVYINFGEFVFDGIGKVDYESDRVGQLNYAFYSGKKYSLNNDPYKYTIKWYKDDVLYFERSDGRNSALYKLTGSQIDGEWDAVTANDKEELLFIDDSVSTDYTYVTLSDETYALTGTSSGITKAAVKDNKISENAITVSSDSSATIIAVKKDDNSDNTFLYYSVSGDNDVKVKRVVLDGSEEDFIKYPVDEDSKLLRESLELFGVEYASGWFLPEFVGNKMFFAGQTDGMTAYCYTMVCDLNGANGVMTNAELKAVNENLDDLFEKIEEYSKGDNAEAYNGLSNALKYAFYTGDADYINELIKAYVDIDGKDEEYAYTKASLEIYNAFLGATGDWADYAKPENTKKVNGKDVRSNSVEYYFSVVGKVTESDAEAIKDGYKSSYMKNYPVDNSTWWQKLSTGEKVGFIIGMVACGLLVIAGATVLTVFLIKRKKNKDQGVSENTIKVDITDDKTVDVYGDEIGDTAEIKDEE